MRNKLAAATSAGFILASMTGVAFAHNHGGNGQGAHVTIGGLDAKLGVEYRFDFEHRDNKFTEVKDGPDATATNLFHLRTFNLTLDGRISRDLSYTANIQMAGDRVSNQWFVGSWSVTDELTVNFGHGFLNQGGWEWRNFGSGYDAILLSQYASSFGTADFVEVAFETVGVVSLQLANEDAEGMASRNWSNSVNKQPMAVLQYVGTFGPASPLLQYGMYDNGKSNFINIGVAFDVADVKGSFDYLLNNAETNTGGGDSETTKITSMVLKVAYDAGMAVPFLKYTSHDVTQFGTNQDANLARDVGEDGRADANPTFNNDSMHWAIGADFTAWGDGFVPHAAIVSRSGNFPKIGDTGEESLSDMALLIGLKGKF